MKIHVCRTMNEWMTGMSKRTFDGTCRISYYISGINIYSNVGSSDFDISYHIDYEIAVILLKYIIKFYNEDKDEVFDWSFQGQKGEGFDQTLSEELCERLNEKMKYKRHLTVCEPTDNKELCPYHLNPIAIKIVSDKISNPLESKF